MDHRQGLGAPGECHIQTTRSGRVPRDDRRRFGHDNVIEFKALGFLGSEHRDRFLFGYGGDHRLLPRRLVGNDHRGGSVLVRAVRPRRNGQGTLGGTLGRVGTLYDDHLGARSPHGVGDTDAWGAVGAEGPRVVHDLTGHPESGQEFGHPPAVLAGECRAEHLPVLVWKEAGRLGEVSQDGHGSARAATRQ